MSQKNFFPRLILFILLGMIAGGILGECLGALFGELGELMNAGGYNNIVHNVFVSHFDFNFGLPDKTNPPFGSFDVLKNPFVVNLNLIRFAFGFSIKLNLVSLIGMGVAIYIMKWSGER